jgi:hypothetical protein
MGHAAGLVDLEKVNPLAPAGIRTTDRPARSLVAVPNTPYSPLSSLPEDDKVVPKHVADWYVPVQ